MKGDTIEKNGVVFTEDKDGVYVPDRPLRLEKEEFWDFYRWKFFVLEELENEAVLIKAFTKFGENMGAVEKYFKKGSGDILRGGPSWDD